jgi:hypothetical protein
MDEISGYKLFVCLFVCLTKYFNYIGRILLWHDYWNIIRYVVTAPQTSESSLGNGSPTPATIKALLKTVFSTRSVL